jgi:hypothetical protein
MGEAGMHNALKNLTRKLIPNPNLDDSQLKNSKYSVDSLK